jgi:hypothetical protein
MLLKTPGIGLYNFYLKQDNAPYSLSKNTKQLAFVHEFVRVIFDTIQVNPTFKQFMLQLDVPIRNFRNRRHDCQFSSHVSRLFKLLLRNCVDVLRAVNLTRKCGAC